jgi:hypothetical protein
VHRARPAGALDVRHPAYQTVCRHQRGIGAGVVIPPSDQPARHKGHDAMNQLFWFFCFPLLIRPAKDHDVARTDVSQGYWCDGEAIAGSKSAPHAVTTIEANLIITGHLSHHGGVNGIPVYIVLREAHSIDGRLVAGVIENFKGLHFEFLGQKERIVQVLVPQALYNISRL